MVALLSISRHLVACERHSKWETVTHQSTVKLSSPGYLKLVPAQAGEKQGTEPVLKPKVLLTWLQSGLIGLLTTYPQTP